MLFLFFVLVFIFCFLQYKNLISLFVLYPLAPILVYLFHPLFPLILMLNYFCFSFWFYIFLLNQIAAVVFSKFIAWYFCSCCRILKYCWNLFDLCYLASMLRWVLPSYIENYVTYIGYKNIHANILRWPVNRPKMVIWGFECVV